jgi:predicted aspartyl protease
MALPIVRLLAALGLLGSAAVVVAQQPARSPGGAKPIEIPFEFRTKQPMVHGQVNGGATVPFVVDTGATIHLLDQGVAEKAQVVGGRAVPLSGAGTQTVETRWVDGLTIAFGGQTWTGQRAAVAPLGYPDRKHFAALIGAPILMRYTAQFDFPQKMMRLFDPAAYTAPHGALQVPFELLADLPVIHVTIDAGSGPLDARLMVDTGAGTHIDLNRPFVEKHGLVALVTDAKATDRPAALGGTAPFLYGTGKSASVIGHTSTPGGGQARGGIVFGPTRLGLSRAQSGSSASSARDGVIGNLILERYVMTVDYRRRVIVLEDPLAATK